MIVYLLWERYSDDEDEPDTDLLGVYGTHAKASDAKRDAEQDQRKYRELAGDEECTFYDIEARSVIA